MKQRRSNYTRTLLAVACGLSLNLPTLLLGAEGTAVGEQTDQQGQQGIGLSGGGAPGGPASSNVVMGGPDIVVGQISQIDGDRYSVVGDRGQEISLRVTKDTNLVCAGGSGGQLRSGRETRQEQHEIAPTPFMERQAGPNGELRTMSEQEIAQQTRRDLNPNAPGALTKDPARLLDKVGSTDPKANEDVAVGSGFVVGGKEGCQFEIGDPVRVEASDMGTATTMQQLAKAPSDESMNHEMTR
jgi:hypothetical protein